jgi:hypothetical protein
MGGSAHFDILKRTQFSMSDDDDDDEHSSCVNLQIMYKSVRQLFSALHSSLEDEDERNEKRFTLRDEGFYWPKQKT